MRKRNFAGMSIQAVRKMHILDCYQEMQEDGVGNGSITLIHKVLSAMFNHAVSEDYIRRNYAHGCTKNNKKDALTQAQQVEFLKFIKESKEYINTIGCLSSSLKRAQDVARESICSGKM